jgi:ATP-dependent RNA helicase RhlE
MSFDTLGLLPELLRAVREQGYETPTPVQAQAIPIILEGRDLMAGAQTGTGKTAAFTLPLLQRLAPGANTSASPARHPIRALILTPTRELAMQVEESVRTYGKYVPLRSTTIFGGVNINPQIKALRGGVEILVATPGRLLDHHQQGTLNFSQLELLVLDEADRMLDMGFIRDIKKILGLLPAGRQNILCSATFSGEIRELAASLLKNPASVDVAPRNSTVELIQQMVHPVDRGRKRALLAHLIQSRKMEQVLVFTRTKHGANHLAEQLGKDGIAASAIHGNKSQPQRIKALSDFKQGQIRVLVATDIAARGLDIDQLPHVVNYELPQVAEDYVHRIGRTGRAGAEGEALSLVCVDETKLLRDIEKLLKRTLPAQVIPGFDPDPSIKAEPIETGKRSGGPRSNAPRREGGPRPASSASRPSSGASRSGNARPRRPQVQSVKSSL